MKYRPSILAVLIILSSQSFAEAACPDLEGNIEHTIKAIALLSAEGMSDNSAPRETSRQLKINNEFHLMNINLALLSQNRCPIRATPINPGIYFPEALTCVTARLTRKDEDSACDMKGWKGSK